MTDDRFQHAVEHALMAFWNQFAACYPEITTGDLDPLTDHRFAGMAETAAREWLMLNTPDSEAPSTPMRTIGPERQYNPDPPKFGGTGIIVVRDA